MNGIELPEDELDIEIIEEHEDKARSPFNEADSLVESLPLWTQDVLAANNEINQIEWKSR